MGAALEPGNDHSGNWTTSAAPCCEKEGPRSAPELTYNFPGATCISVGPDCAHGVLGGTVVYYQGRRPRSNILDVSARAGRLFRRHRRQASCGPAGLPSASKRLCRDAAGPCGHGASARCRSPARG
ncbi:hypothetical protein ACRAWD_28495 [Caulobacter segnis]